MPKKNELQWAAHRGNLNKVKTLLAEGKIDINERDDTDKLTALHYAVGEGHLGVTRALLAAGADVNLGDGIQNTPALCLAATMSGHPAIPEVLLAAGANPNQKDNTKITPLHYAVHDGHVEVVRVLLAAGADVNIEGGPCDHTALQSSIMGRKVHGEIVKLLLAHGADPNKPDKQLGSSPLLLTLKIALEEPKNANHALESIKALFAHGAVYDGSDKLLESFLVGDGEGKWTPTEFVQVFKENKKSQGSQEMEKKTELHLAAQQGDAKRVKDLLFKRKIDIQVSGDVLVKRGKIDQKDPNRFAPLHYAASEGHHEVVHALLVCGADRDLGGGQDEKPPLAMAASFGHSDVVRALLAVGANINKTSDTKYTPLHYAVMFGHLEVVRVLLEGGADVNQVGGPFGHPVLISAILEEEVQVDIVLVLLTNGADPNKCDGYEMSPMSHVIKKSLEQPQSVAKAIEVMKLLLASGYIYDETDETLNSLLARASKDVIEVFHGKKEVKGQTKEKKLDENTTEVKAKEQRKFVVTDPKLHATLQAQLGKWLQAGLIKKKSQ